MKTFSYFILSFVVIGLASCQSPKKEISRPNILYIMSDDHASHAISAYGGIYDSLAPTPNIDRLATEGVLFENVFCTNGICGPSRATILTGKYSHVNGYYKNESGGKFNNQQWTFPEELQKNGYTTSLFGKWHLGSEPVGFDTYKFHQGGGQQGFYWNPIYNENGKEVTEEGYATNLTTNFALSWLDSIKANGKPFAMILQYKAPHRPWDPDEKYIGTWDDIEFPYPATFNDDYKGREKTAGDTWMTMDYFNNRDMKMTPPDSLNGVGVDLQAWQSYGNNPGELVIPEGMTEEEAVKWRYQKYIKDYLLCVRSVDDNIGRVLDYLDENGLAENTIVVYTSDQGFYLGDHGFFDKRFIYEESLRMPFLMRYPQKLPAGTTNKDIITNIDFAPTFLEAAGIASPGEVQGSSFLHNAMGHTPDSWRQSMYYHYYEFPFWHHVQPHYGMRNQRYKLAHFYYSIDAWEFYDLEKDPDELNNAINDPQYASIISEMKDELKALMKTYADDASLENFREITDKDLGLIE